MRIVILKAETKDDAIVQHIMDIARELIKRNELLLFTVEVEAEG